MFSRWLAAIVVVATGLMASCSSHMPRQGAYWGGHLTITLPPSLATPGAPCSGRAGTMWSDIRPNAAVSVRSAAGHELAHWTLPAGATHTTVEGHRAPRGCSFVLPAADGISTEIRPYQLVVARHTLRIPARKLGGNVFIVLPDRIFHVDIRVR
jgi:hypothetical protein